MSWWLYCFLISKFDSCVYYVPSAILGRNLLQKSVFVTDVKYYLCGQNITLSGTMVPRKMTENTVKVMKMYDLSYAIMRLGPNILYIAQCLAFLQQCFHCPLKGCQGWCCLFLKEFPVFPVCPFLMIFMLCPFIALIISQLQLSLTETGCPISTVVLMLL